MPPQEVPRPVNKFISDLFYSVDLLSPQQLKRLEEHKYSSQGKSILEPFFQHYWTWLVEQVPRTIAPNLITLVGLVANCIGMLILMVYCPTATEEAPRWTYIFAAFTLFFYQSLDAIDGKQARRTNSATPLGELFDHGCDSVSVSFVSVEVAVALQLGTSPNLSYLFYAVSFLMFYAAHWQAYVSGTLRFGIIDVTEGQCIYCVSFLVSAMFGPQFWSNTILGMELKWMACMFGLAVAIFTMYNYCNIIIKGGKGRSGSTVANTSVIAPFFHIGAVLLLAFMIWQKSKTNLYEDNICIYILTFGMVAAKITNKLVVAHMTKSAMNFLDIAFLGPFLLFINQYLDALIPEYIVLYIALIFSTFDLIRYSTSVTLQICDHLEIYCFDIVSKRSEKEDKKS